MHDLKKTSTMVFLALALAGCGGGASGSSGSSVSPVQPSGNIVLSPNGTAAAPVNESIFSPFILTASESGYSGDFTARTIVGSCWVVQSPTTAFSAFVVSPSGLICIGGFNGDTEQIQVTDSLGNSAVTYIHSI